MNHLSETSQPPPIGVHFAAAVRQRRIVNCTNHAKKFGFKYRVGMSRGLFSAVYPVSEEGYKGETFEERLENIYKEYKRHAEFAISDSMFFKVKIGSLIKNYVSHLEIHTHKELQNTEIEILACSPDDENGQPCLLLFHRAEFDKYKFKDILQVSQRTAVKA